MSTVQEEVLTTEALSEQIEQEVSYEAILSDYSFKDDNEELYEEITGKIMQAEDGRFFVATDVNTSDVDFDTISKIEVIVNLDSTETVIFEAEPISLDEQTERQKDIKENIRVANVSSRSNHILDHEMEVAEMATADDNENGMYLSYDEAEMKYGRRNRKHGKAICPECNQSFVNTARLERHLSVHQVIKLEGV